MLLHCDYVLLAQDAQLITPFVNLALVPEAASSYLMPLRIGHARAFRDVCDGGSRLDAQTAVAWGIANKVCNNDQLRAEARRMAERIAAKPAGSLSAMKALMRKAEALVAQMDSEEREVPGTADERRGQGGHLPHSPRNASRTSQRWRSSRRARCDAGHSPGYPSPSSVASARETCPAGW